MLLLLKCIVIILTECVSALQDALLNQLLIETSTGSSSSQVGSGWKYITIRWSGKYMLRLGSSGIRNRKVPPKLYESGEKCSLYLFCLLDGDIIEDNVCKQHCPGCCP